MSTCLKSFLDCLCQDLFSAKDIDAKSVYIKSACT